MSTSTLPLAALLAACSVLSPPPVIPAHQPAQPLPEGTVSVRLIVGVGGSLFISDHIGAAIQVGYQARADLDLGLSTAPRKFLTIFHRPARRWLRCSSVT